MEKYSSYEIQNSEDGSGSLFWFIVNALGEATNPVGLSLKRNLDKSSWIFGWVAQRRAVNWRQIFLGKQHLLY